MERVRDSVKKELLKGLSEEQVAKVKACKSHEELLALAKKEGIELTDEQLETISGGGLCTSAPAFTCPKCDSGYVKWKRDVNGYMCECKHCGYEWMED